MAEHDLYVDVTYEIPVDDLRLYEDPSKHLFEVMRHKAEALCDQHGARLRTDRAPEIIIKQGKHVLGFDVTLAASRWPVVAPTKVARQVR